MVEILLVEDDIADAKLVLKALEEGRLADKLIHVKDGVEAWALLNERKTNEEPLPDIILTDLNMPRMDGRELLQKIKSHDEFMSIPCIVLTSSDSPSDIKMSYKLNANCYVSKPDDLDDFYDVMRSLDKFWLGIASLSSQTEEYS